MAFTRYSFYFVTFFLLFYFVSSQFNGPPPSGITFKKPPSESSNVTVDVQINTGNVSATIKGLQFSYGNSYRGIPYAQPPIGKLRFEYAVRKDPNGVVNALQYGASCSQKAMKIPLGKSKTSEDCLFINVFTPLNVTKDSRLPVYMFYHYGGYVGGDGNLDQGIFPNLVNRGPIIMVSMNYRVGPFGFFTTRDSTAPGNWATSDWIEALNWVNRYISFFGGDPKRITIGGQSAGAESIILFCLRNKTSSQIMAVDDSLINHRSKWSLVQDKKYFPERLEDLAMKRDKTVNVLTGNVNSEWIFFEDRSYMTTNVNSSRNSKSEIKKDLAASYEISYYQNVKEVLNKAENVYMNVNRFSSYNPVDWEAKRLQLWSEMVFIGPVLRDALFRRSNGNTVYLYSLDWLSPNALPDVTESKLRGVSHGTELSYLFETSCQFYNCTSGDNLLRQYFSTSWVNFIKYGNPTPSESSLPFRWLPMNQSNRFLSFSPTPKMQSNYHPDAMFWTCTAPKIDGYNGPFC